MMETSQERNQEIIGKLNRLEEEIRKSVFGQTKVIREVLVAALSGGHALIEGVPGLGKTLIVKSIAAAIDSDFARIQFTPDLMPNDISGHVMYEMKSNTFKVRKGPVFTNLLLADEINRAPAKTQSALLEVMQEQQVSIEGRPYPLETPFFVLATQNPIEQEGTYPLPQAQLDRFLLKVFIDYPEEDVEKKIVKIISGKSFANKLDVSSIENILSTQEIIDIQKYISEIKTDDTIIDYAVSIVRSTRGWNGIEIGAGPRGTISLLQAARAHAVLSGSTFVTPDDIKEMAPSVLRHRIKLTTDLEIEGFSPDDVLTDILSQVEAPRI